MKKLNIILSAILLVMFVGCKDSKHLNDALIHIDLSKSYPKKELILQDFMDVEYVPLETTDDFLTQGIVKAVGKEYLVVTNRFNDGEIFIFHRKTGKGIRKINRQGQGGEEYTRINEIVLDENNDEIFVKTLGNKILVYDLYGNFKRCLALDREVSSVFDYDKDHLICYDMTDYHSKGEERTKSYHIMISKQDGSITNDIYIPFKTINTPIVKDKDRFIANYSYQIRLSNGEVTLMDTSADTLYNYASDGTLIPFVTRIPPVNTMNPEVFLYMGIHTDRYYFMEAVNNVFNFEKGNGFHSDILMYDKIEKAIYQVTVYNNDYIEKRPVAMTAKSINREVESVTTLNASPLIETFKKGKLKEGPLKEIVSKLNDEDNPVIMVVKQKQ